MSVTTGVVLAAGEGTRLRPLTRNRPKPMLPAADRPILEYVLDALVDAGVERICLVVGYKRDRVQDHFGSSYRDVPVEYVHQAKQLGSGHALLQARDACEGPLLAVNGDRIIEADMVRDVLAAFEGGPTLAVIDHPEVRQYGAVTLDGDRVTSLVEKPAGEDYHLINAGIYAFPADVYDEIEATPRREGELQLTDTIGRYIDGGTDVRGARTGGTWVDATYPWDLLSVARRLLSAGMVGQQQVVQVSPDVHVAASARVHDDATLQAPAVVGPDVEIAAGAVVGPDVAVGRNATVGPNATVERSVLDVDTRVGAGSVLRDCVTGTEVALGPGTLVPGGAADVRVGTEVFEGQRLGAVLADRVRAAGGVTCAPGTLVGPSARLGPGVTVEGNVPEGSEVVR